uniref:DEP domain-containing protein n=1 Tax=Hucho hucho TaxID=62062 RepID=A0A4W5KT51_9TELE
MMNTETSILATREEEGETFERTLVASELVDWLLAEGEMATREEAEHLGRRLLEHGIMQHVTNKHHFVDGGLLYQFRLNFRRRRRLMELLNERCRTIPESHDSPFCLRKQNPEGGNTSFLSGKPQCLAIKCLYKALFTSGVVVPTLSTVTLGLNPTTTLSPYSLGTIYTHTGAESHYNP